MADDLLTTLIKFHREIVRPDMERLIEEKVTPRFDEINARFDDICRRLDRLSRLDS